MQAASDSKDVKIQHAAFSNFSLAADLGIECFLESRIYFDNDRFIGLKAKAGYCSLKPLQEMYNHSGNVTTGNEDDINSTLVFSNTLTYSATIAYGMAF